LTVPHVGQLSFPVIPKQFATTLSTRTLYVSSGVNLVKVSVADVRVEHEVKLMDFTKWLDRMGGSPREVSDRRRIRFDLGHAGRTVRPQTKSLAAVEVEQDDKQNEGDA
jgi:hypothetical protein